MADRPVSHVDPDTAFSLYVAPEVGALYRVARAVVNRPADAEDLVQETLLRAYRSIATFDGAHPRAWLFTILRNTNVNQNRRRRPGLLQDPDATFARLAEEAIDPCDPETIVVGHQFDAVVADALDALGTQHRSVVDLVDLQGLSYAEAATALGVPVGTVMSRLHRARRKIKDQVLAAGLVRKRAR